MPFDIFYVQAKQGFMFCVFPHGRRRWWRWPVASRVTRIQPEGLGSVNQMHALVQHSIEWHQIDPNGLYKSNLVRLSWCSGQASPVSPSQLVGNVAGSAQQQSCIVYFLICSIHLPTCWQKRPRKHHWPDTRSGPMPWTRQHYSFLGPGAVSSLLRLSLA